jgi:hypothetical protein
MNLKISNSGIIILSVVYDHPFFKILTNISFVPFKKIFRISTSLRRWRSKFRVYATIPTRFYWEVFATIHVGIVFYVIEQNLIPVNNFVALLAVSISRLDLEGNP